jgi:hypothetical protein
MTRVIGRLADQLLSIVVPTVAAHAARQLKCMRCWEPPSSRGWFYQRDCVRGVCEPWGRVPGTYCGQCGV